MKPFSLYPFFVCFTLLFLCSCQESAVFKKTSLVAKNVSVKEGSKAVVEVSLKTPRKEDTILIYQTIDGTAKSTGSSDFRATHRKEVIIPAGKLTPRKPITIDISDDHSYENDEYFTVMIYMYEKETDQKRSKKGFSLENLNTTIATKVLIIIKDNDPLPSLTLGNVTVNEGDGTASIPYSTQAPITREIDIVFSTKRGTAESNQDYISLTNHSVKISPQNTTGFVTISLIDDNILEYNESFTVKAKLPEIQKEIGSAEILIIDNEVGPALSLQDVTVNEKARRATLSYSLNKAIPLQSRFYWKTRDGSATSPTDYRAASGMITIPPGVQSGSFNITIVDNDSIHDDGESFEVVVNSSLNRLIDPNKGKLTAQVNIIDNTRPSLSLHDITVNESSRAATVRYSLQYPSTQTISFSWSTQENTATEDSDYITVTDQPISISPRRSSGNLSITVKDDDLIERAESFDVLIRNINANGATSPSRPDALNCTVTISANDNDILDSFSGKSPQGSMLDILWVIDNSNSMAHIQSKLAQNFSSFINEFIGNSLDFNMAIITSDSSTDHVSSNSPLNSQALANDQSAFIAEFQNKIAVGASGNANERGIAMSADFLTQNTSWIRQDAFLFIIYVSDEQDNSSHPNAQTGTVEGETDPWIKDLRAHKSEDPSLLKVYSIINSYHPSWASYLNQKRLRYMAETTKGGTLGITMDFAIGLSQMAQEIEILSRSYLLSQQPLSPSGIEVRVNGARISSQNWEYNQTKNMITFADAHVPSTGANIKVSYRIKIP